MITARIEVCKYIFLHVMNYISDDVGTAKGSRAGTAQEQSDWDSRRGRIQTSAT